MDHASGSLVILRDMFRCFLEKQDSTGNFLHNLVKKKLSDHDKVNMCV